MDKNSGKLHPFMTITALAVTVAALATIAVIVDVVPDRARPANVVPGAAAAAFATPLAASPTADAPAGACSDCATIVSVQPTGPESWNVAVRMADGSHRLFAAESQPSWHAGEQVRITNGIIMSM